MPEKREKFAGGKGGGVTSDERGERREERELTFLHLRIRISLVSSFL